MRIFTIEGKSFTYPLLVNFGREGRRIVEVLFGKVADFNGSNAMVALDKGQIAEGAVEISPAYGRKVFPGTDCPESGALVSFRLRQGDRLAVVFNRRSGDGFCYCFEESYLETVAEFMSHQVYRAVAHDHEMRSRRPDNEWQKCAAPEMPIFTGTREQFEVRRRKTENDDCAAVYTSDPCRYRTRWEKVSFTEAGEVYEPLSYDPRRPVISAQTSVTVAVGANNVVRAVSTKPAPPEVVRAVLKLTSAVSKSIASNGDSKELSPEKLAATTGGRNAKSDHTGCFGPNRRNRQHFRKRERQQFRGEVEYAASRE